MDRWRGDARQVRARFHVRRSQIWHAVRQRLPVVPARADVEASYPAARARAIAEALALFLLGFVLDDLRALRVPGFAVGAALAIIWLGIGSTVHAYRIAGSLAHLEPGQRASRLAIQTSVMRVAAFGVFLVCLSWLMVTAGGVNLWPA